MNCLKILMSMERVVIVTIRSIAEFIVGSAPSVMLLVGSRRLVEVTRGILRLWCKLGSVGHHNDHVEIPSWGGAVFTLVSTVLFATRANVVGATPLNVSIEKTQLALVFAIFFARDVFRIKPQLGFLIDSMSSSSL